MSKIDKKKSSSKIGHHHIGSCQQYKQYRELLNRYADCCPNWITKESIETVKLFVSFKTSFPAKRVELLELEKETCEVMLLFHLAYSYEKLLGVPSAYYKSKSKLKKDLRRRIKRINLRARKIIKDYI